MSEIKQQILKLVKDFYDENHLEDLHKVQTISYQ